MKRRVGVSGHRFFLDKEREVNARTIDWALNKCGGVFATLTFKNEVSEYRAQKLRDKWLARAQQSLNDKGGHSLNSICAKEFQSRGVIHYHLSLVSQSINLLSRKSLEDRWRQLSGGMARCYDARSGCAVYLSKYTSKSLSGDLEWGGTWRDYNFPASIGRFYAEKSPSVSA